MIIAALILLALGLFYAGLLTRWSAGLQHVLRGPRHSDDLLQAELPFVSVIVPARDEETTIERCLTSILANDYPEDRFEVIVVDDLSRDATASRVRVLIERLTPTLVPAGFDDEPEEGRLRLFQVSPNLERSAAHKKRAITLGISHARGSIVLTTDADCVAPPNWIAHMAGTFGEDTALVSGPVLYPTEGSVAERAQALEFLGLVTVGAAAIGAGAPNLCNGANVAYRRDVFEDLGGFSGIDHLTSGDDELLMQKIAYQTDWRVRFCAHPQSAVVTRGAPSLRAFFEQRRRWASKGGHYPHKPLRATVAGIYAFYVALTVATISVLLVPTLWPAVLMAWLLKIVPESLLLVPAARHFDRSRLLRLFLPMQPVHAAYIVLMGAAGAAGGYTWKGRRIAR